MLFVAVFETERVYGGPEEGGWWYTEGSLSSVEAVFTEGWAAVRANRVADSLPVRRIGSARGYEVRVYGPGEKPPAHFSTGPACGRWDCDCDGRAGH